MEKYFQIVMSSTARTANDKTFLFASMSRSCHFPVWCVYYLKLERITVGIAAAIARIRLSHHMQSSKFDKVVNRFFPFDFLFRETVFFFCGFISET